MRGGESVFKGADFAHILEGSRKPRVLFFLLLLLLLLLLGPLGSAK